MNTMRRNRVFAKVVLTASLFALQAATSYGRAEGPLFKTSEASIKAAQAFGGCSVHNVAGTYGYSGSGFAVVPNPFGTPPTPVNEVGTFVLNDDGTFTITKLVQNINGFVFPGGPVTGTYTVSPDCTINATNQFGFSFFGVFVDDRKEIRYAVVGGPEPGRARGVITYVAKRM
jgi:hypothetical protein